ncbi:MAG: FkbM family methyltransferase [Opitutaceae bacterium]|nr:FkbM family methyltransferase [Opitutaceae bacterium]
MKARVKSLLSALGIVVVRRTHPGAPYLDLVPSGILDCILVKLFDEARDLTLVQIGANDGTRADPLHKHITARGWHALLVEPLPDFYSQLTGHHAGNPRVTCLNAAVDDSCGRREIHQIDPALKHLPDWAWGLASFDRDRVVKAACELGRDETDVRSSTVTTVDWSEIWRLVGDHRCDLLVIDTEGQDIRLLRLANLALRRPRIVHFEHACVEQSERLAFYQELLEIGYELATDGPDSIAWLRD